MLWAGQGERIHELEVIRTNQGAPYQALRGAFLGMQPTSAGSITGKQDTKHTNQQMQNEFRGNLSGTYEWLRIDFRNVRNVCNYVFHDIYGQRGNVLHSLEWVYTIGRVKGNKSSLENKNNSPLKVTLGFWPVFNLRPGTLYSLF